MPGAARPPSCSVSRCWRSSGPASSPPRSPIASAPVGWSPSATVLLPLGLVLTSRVDTVVGGYLTYGVGVGVGGGLVIAPMFTAAGGWIVRRRALALGVLAAGNGLGTLILVPFAERLIADNGWRDAYVILAVVDLVVIVACCLVVRRPPVPPAPPAVAWMKAVAATDAFRRLFLTTLLFSVALYVAFGFIVDFATDDGVESGRAALLVGLIGASSVIGRLGLTTLSGRVPAVRLLQGCLAVQPVAFAVWLVAERLVPVAGDLRADARRRLRRVRRARTGGRARLLRRRRPGRGDGVDVPRLRPRWFDRATVRRLARRHHRRIHRPDHVRRRHVGARASGCR